MSIKFQDLIEVNAKRDCGDIELGVSAVKDPTDFFIIKVIEGAAFCRCHFGGFDNKDYVATYGILSDMVGTIVQLPKEMTTKEPTEWLLEVIDAYKHA